MRYIYNAVDYDEEVDDGKSKFTVWTLKLPSSSKSCLNKLLNIHQGTEDKMRYNKGQKMNTIIIGHAH